MFVYQLLIRLLAPLIWLITLIEAVKRRGGLRFLKQRLGYGYKMTTSPQLWIHCASVGEVKAVEPLVRALLPEKDILITTNTPTGSALVKQLFEDDVLHVYCPLDWPYAIRQFILAFRPSELWVVETEIWPNLYRLVSEERITITLINARLSKKTLKSPKWLQSAYQKTLSHVTQILARNSEEANRFLQLGASADQVTILGNLKYAGLLALPDYPNPINRPYVLLASSHKSEELAVAQLWLSLKRPELLVIVPRHPKRIKEVIKDLVPYRDHLKIFSQKQQPDQHTQIFVDDQIGALMPLYAHASLVIMGGSFVAKGGHNILEPAALKAPIITGKDMSDFEMETQQMLSSGGIVQCKNYRELKDAIVELIDQSDQKQQMGEAAYQTVLTQKHVLNDYLVALNQTETNTSF